MLLPAPPLPPLRLARDGLVLPVPVPRLLTLPACAALWWLHAQSAFVSILEEMHRQDIASLIAAMPFFSPLNERLRSTLAQLFSYEVVPPGSTLFSQGSEGDVFCILLKGELSVWQSGEKVHAATRASDLAHPSIDRVHCWPGGVAAGSPQLPSHRAWEATRAEGRVLRGVLADRHACDSLALRTGGDARAASLPRRDRAAVQLRAHSDHQM